MLINSTFVEMHVMQAAAILNPHKTAGLNFQYYFLY